MTINPPHDRDFELEALLDALGAEDRDSAPDAMEPRLRAEIAANESISRRLDSLAAADRADAPADLDARLLSAVAEAFVPAPIPISRARAVVRLARWSSAAAALLAVAALAWFAMRPAPVSPQPTIVATANDHAADDVELMLELFSDESWSVDLVNLQTDADTIGDTLGSPWDDLESLSDSLTEGAI
ncbi:MAG: hypothetical protein R3B49_10040 [Phycisphaerales bacterium]